MTCIIDRNMAEAASECLAVNRGCPIAVVYLMVFLGVVSVLGEKWYGLSLLRPRASIHPFESPDPLISIDTLIHGHFDDEHVAHRTLNGN